MTKSKATPLGADIVTVQKGGAAPLSHAATTELQSPQESIHIPAYEPAASKPPRGAIPLTAPASEPVALLAMKNISVKVDIVTYKKLKRHGGDMDGKTNQAIFTEALALYFAKHGIK